MPPPRYALLACAATLQSGPAFASKEGAGLVDAVRVIVAIALVAFTACVAGGALHGAIKASRNGESIPAAIPRGLLKGLIAFAIVGAASVGVLTVLGMLWVAYSFLYVYVLNPDAGR